MTVTYADDGEGVSDDDDGEGEAIRIHTGIKQWHHIITLLYYAPIERTNNRQEKKEKGKEDVKVNEGRGGEQRVMVDASMDWKREEEKNTNAISLYTVKRMEKKGKEVCYAVLE